LCARTLETCRDLQIEAANTGMVRQFANELMLSGLNVPLPPSLAGKDSVTM